MRDVFSLFLALLPAAAMGAELPQGKELTNSVGMEFSK